MNVRGRPCVRVCSREGQKTTEFGQGGGDGKKTSSHSTITPPTDGLLRPDDERKRKEGFCNRTYTSQVLTQRPDPAPLLYAFLATDSGDATGITRTGWRTKHELEKNDDKDRAVNATVLHPSYL